ncbi:MAG: hypothetical protein WA019_04015 [Candidatus Moraniibacteriota bacterium]
MNYKFNRNGVSEEVLPELWRWEAYFNDGTFLKQFGDDGVFHQFAEIDQSKLAVFKMTSPDFPQVFAMPFDPKTMKLVHYYKKTGLAVGTPEFREIKCYCFGFEKKRIGRSEKHFVVIVPNGEFVICEDPNILNFE